MDKAMILAKITTEQMNKNGIDGKRMILVAILAKTVIQAMEECIKEDNFTDKEQAALFAILNKAFEIGIC